jgi:uncharacterized membrane protein
VRSIVPALGPVCLGVGAVLLGESLAMGGARLYWILVIPVITGTSPLFGISVAFLVAGFLLLPLVFAGEEPTPTLPATSSTPPGTPTDGESGGVILLGPFPFFFGSWRRNPPISYRWAVLLGVVFAVVAVLLLWGWSVL